MNGGRVGDARHSAPQLFLGVDGGKTKTICLLADAAGHVLGWGRSGSSDKYYRPIDEALNEVRLAAIEACQMAKVDPNQIDAGVFGLAGADWPEDFKQLEHHIQQLGLARLVVVKNDMHIALRANIQSGSGVLLSAGTHLAAAIRLEDGGEWHSGWFSVNGAGGVYAGERLFWAVMRAEDGRGRPSILTQMLLDVSGKERPLDLLRDLSAGKLDDQYFASLAPLLFEAHLNSRDPVAAGIITEMGQDISLWAIGLLERYDLVEESIPIFLSGGIFKTQDPLLVDTIVQSVHSRLPLAKIHLAKSEPVIGALYYAFELGGLELDEERLTIIKNTAASVWS